MLLRAIRKNCLAAGMDDYIPKPVEPINIKEVLTKWARARKNNNEADAAEVDNAANGQNTDASAAANEPDKVNDEFAGMPVFDNQKFLDRIMGDEALAVMVIDGFLNDIPGQIEKLEELVNSKETEKAGRQAHSIKGASANVGGEILRAVSLSMEKAGGAGDQAELESRLPVLIKEFARLKEQMLEIYQAGVK